MSVNFIVEATHHKIGEDLVEVLEYNSILIGDGWGSQEVMHEECSYSLLSDHIVSLGLKLEYEVLYKTIISVTITFTQDYYGEVDADVSVELLYHAEAIDMSVESIKTQYDIDWVPLQTKTGGIK